MVRDEDVSSFPVAPAAGLPFAGVFLFPVIHPNNSIFKQTFSSTLIAQRAIMSYFDAIVCYTELGVNKQCVYHFGGNGGCSIGSIL